MAVTMTRPKLLLPTLSTIIMLAVLVSLGNWQLQRLAWKEAILAGIAHAEASPPAELTGAVVPAFAKIIVHGHWRNGVVGIYGAALGGDPANEVMGAGLLQILDRDNAPPILVDRGWVSTDPQPLPATGAASVTGYARAAESARALAATDDIPGRHFYTLDPQKIGAIMGAPNVAPFTLIALGDAGACAKASTCPVPAATMPRPDNNHLQYALTWYGLALTLLVIYAIWLYGARKHPPPA
jgi:surfeit locus 1 family protein